ncbi:MAG: N-acyl-D-amino-acid deacylase family protein [Chloroflexota bacterium]
MTTYDLLIRGALLVDGSGTFAQHGDLGVRDGHIAAMGAIPADATAERTLSGAGQVLSPGFIDVHTHSDGSLLLDGAGESKVFQGVTTEVVGNCSFSTFPLNLSERRELHADHLARIGDDPVALDWSDLEGYAGVLERAGIAINVAPQVGHGTLRVAAMGLEDRPPSSDELARMRQLAAGAMDQGAFGFSTGLTHVPSAYGDTDEVVALAEVAARFGGHYATHARAGLGWHFRAIDEAVEIGRRSGARVQFSHVAINDPAIWGQHAAVVERFERGREAGVDIVYDVYPYAASSSSLTQYLPGWLQAGGTQVLTERLKDRRTRERARTELAGGWFGGIPWLWDRVVISRPGDPSDGDSAGQSLGALAEQARIPPEELVLRLCETRGNGVHVVLFYRTEGDVQAFLQHPLSVIGSDGSAIPFARTDQPHPRNYGASTRVLGRYVRDLGLLTLTTAVHKMTGRAAERMGIRDRGLLREGLAADLVLFDPERVTDRATFQVPCQPPEGVHCVVVNGEIVVEDGRQTPARPGRVLRHTRA